MANVGIDLGTTNSLVAVVMGEKPRVLLDDEGRAICPSAVRYVEGAEHPLIGWPALEDAADHAGTTLTSVKRFMGRSMAEARAVADQLHYALADDDGKVVRFDVGHATPTPVEVSAWILRLLYMQASECLLAEPGGVVITVPAYFDDAQRQATRDAGRLAGMNVLRLLNEPTAAAIAYGLQEGKEGIYAVYDLGGGTFDVSILELTEGVFQVLSTAGDTQLGGDDFDRLLLAELKPGETLSGGALRAGMELAESTKRALTDSDQANGVTRARFAELIAPLLERTLASCAQAVKDAELTLDDLDGVVLVGGSTRVPAVRDAVRRFFGSEPYCDLDPDQVVALGAAVQADILTGSSDLADDVLLMDVIPLSLGIETMGGVVEKLILRCSPIPATASETFTTQVDGQSGVDLHVVQGERELAKDCRSLARFKLSGLPDMPAGLPRVKVELTVDADGILHVSATEQYTKTHAEVDVQPSYGLEEGEIERMLEEAIDHAETDVDQRMLIEARVEAEQVLFVVAKAVRDDGHVLLACEGEAIEAAVSALKASMEQNDRHRIRALTEKLDEVTAPFAQRRIERDLRLALSGQDAERVLEQLKRATPSE
mgnify:CR=1 FL=1